MITVFGNIALVFALLCAIIQSVVPLLGYYRTNPYALASARPAAFAQCFGVMTAYALLTIAFVTSDFSLLYVASNSHPTLPLLYRLTAVWGGHEGSILLWIVMLNLWTIAYACIKKTDALTLVFLGMLSVSFLCFLLFTSNPFIAVPYALPGHDLNPLLQDPGFVIHPPMLYAGYVGFSVAFAITLAALIRGQLNKSWALVTRQFALAAFCFLTLGIALGSWWAYRVLGWGGFWFWDPVENASLLPWLSGVALIHVLVIAEKRNVAKNWAALLAIMCFGLSLLGTFLVRSGVLVSAHTFANDPERGLFLLLLFAVLMTTALAVFVIRSQPQTQPIKLAWLSRDMGLLINSALLTIAMLTVLLGTIYPLILDALQLGTISVGAPYFNQVMAPLTFLIMACMGLALMKSWQEAWKKCLASVVIGIALFTCIHQSFHFTALLALILSIWVIISVARLRRLLPGMAIAHTGFAIMILGILLSSTLQQEQEVRLRPGQATRIGPYQFFFISTEGIQAGNYRGIRADFEVLKNTRHIVNLYPEKRIYTVRDMIMTKVDIHPGIFRDLYIALGEPLDQDTWSIRLYYKPFIRWIWLGGILMIIGGIVAIRQRQQPTSTEK